MSNPNSSLSFTKLVEPGSSVTQATPSAPFDAAMAYLLGQCCSLTYQQFNEVISESTFATSLDLKGDLAGYAISASNLQPFTASEANQPGASSNDADYFTVPAGFAVQLTLTVTGKPTQNMVVIALRGSRTWDEWINDAEAFPTPFAGEAFHLTGDGLGSVHAGFYDRYTVGTDGQRIVGKQALSSDFTQRAPGSLAYQVGKYVHSLEGILPVYVTGHSLGGALATLAALDIAYRFPKTFSKLCMYSLASPRVAVGIDHVPSLDNQDRLLEYYQRLVPNTYQIVHAVDVVPILPPASFNIGPLLVSCAHVTDAYSTNSSNLSGNVISFCAQTGDLAGNHSCAGVYVPYLKQLASNFQTA
ncbi:MAG TPA: lipase family protein [Blastocatellia bacterium]|nr:lipase family protein [Blastocatellia bacterium]HMV82140.1 lipase family protein [Blastocatellia bacterium]HMX25182.1 lipase family protein [Blastocatellia bacterium]HMY72277.1 lipase family protein [Blastocatellia bacterium]HMZ18592.1 lipase family protein [Blastocatellia bacterium]